MSSSGMGDGDGLRARAGPGMLDMTRPAYTQPEFDASHTGGRRRSKSVREIIRSWRVEHPCSCAYIGRLFVGFVPFVGHMRRYSVRRDLAKDFIAGLTVGIMHIPQGMAYGLLANLPPVYGLYTSFFPVLIYSFFGTSRHISIGAFAVVSLMVGTAVDNSQCSEFAVPSSERSHNVSSLADDGLPSTSAPDVGFFDEEMLCKVGTAAAVTLITGIIQLLMGVMQLGFAAVYLSDPLTSGLTTAAAVHVLTSQVRHMLGIVIPKHSGPLKLIYMYIAMVREIQQTNIAVLIMSAVTIALILVTKEFINPRVKPRIHMPLPIELILVVVATLISTVAKFDTWFNVDVVGPVPTGIPPPSLPPSDRYGSVVIDAIGMAIVAFAVNVSLAKMFAKKHNYVINPNQELIAYGTTNVVGSFFNCFTSAASLSRSLVQEAADCQSQVTGLVSCGLLIVVLFAIGPLFEKLPKSILAAIIVANLKGMFEQLRDLKKLWYIAKCDFFIWLVVFLAIILLDVDLGLLVGFIFCLLTVVFRTQTPYTCILGRIPNTDLYKDITVYKEVEEIPGVKIFRFESSLYYANAEYFQEKLSKKTGLDVSLLKSKASSQSCDYARAEEMTSLTMEHDEDTQFRDVDIRYIIIDCTTMGYIDWTAVSMFGKLIEEYQEVGITVYLAGCKAGVRRMMDNAGFFEKIDRSLLCLSIHDAVFTALHNQMKKTTTDRITDEESENCSPKMSTIAKAPQTNSNSTVHLIEEPQVISDVTLESPSIAGQLPVKDSQPIADELSTSNDKQATIDVPQATSDVIPTSGSTVVAITAPQTTSDVTPTSGSPAVAITDPLASSDVIPASRSQNGAPNSQTIPDDMPESYYPMVAVDLPQTTSDALPEADSPVVATEDQQALQRPLTESPNSGSPVVEGP